MFKTGDKVSRVWKNRGVQQGTVIEVGDPLIKKFAGRYRVQWDGSIRTWVGEAKVVSAVTDTSMLDYDPITGQFSGLMAGSAKA